MLRRTLLRRAAAGCSVGSVADDAADSDDRPERETAVVDRVEDGLATLLFDDGRQRTVEATVLPPAAREEGLVVHVPGGDAVALASPDRAATARRRDRAQARFDELSERPPGEDGGGDVDGDPDGDNDGELDGGPDGNRYRNTDGDHDGSERGGGGP